MPSIRVTVKQLWKLPIILIFERLRQGIPVVNWLARLAGTGGLWVPEALPQWVKWRVIKEDVWKLQAHTHTHTHIYKCIHTQTHTYTCAHMFAKIIKDTQLFKEQMYILSSKASERNKYPRCYTNINSVIVQGWKLPNYPQRRSV